MIDFRGVITPTRAALFGLIAAPFAAKLHLIFGLLAANPMLLNGRFASHLVIGTSPFPTDPNNAITSQALGHRAALDLLGGHLPWWNYLEGIGTPLAGEMQSAALFPLTPLLWFGDGQLYFHICLQIIAGVSAYFLMRRMGCARLAAFAAGALFEFNGTFAWQGNAIVNPIPFLPLILLGVETARDRIQSGQLGGWRWIAVGLALSLYAGFPEIAYLDGLLIAAWTLVRAGNLPRGNDLKFLCRVGIGVAVGLLLAAPILIAFGDYLGDAYVGGHAGTGFIRSFVDPGHFANVFLPYLRGWYAPPSRHDEWVFWGAVGGYSGLGLFALATVGALGVRDRPLRVTLAVWVVVAGAASYGVPGVAKLLSFIPAFGLSAFFRYLAPSIEFALAVLAALAANDHLYHRGRQPHRSYWIGITAAILIAGAALYRAAPQLEWLLLATVLSLALGLASVIILVIIGILPIDGRWRAGLLTAGLGAESITFFVIATIGTPLSGHLELGGVRYLQSHLGLQRFYTLGPITPNYGSYFGIAQLNYDDQPVPRDWANYVVAHLDDNIAGPSYFRAESRRLRDGPSAAQNFVKNLTNYLRLGVRYVVVRNRFDAASLPNWPAATPVFADSVMKIYELSGWRPYVAADGCRLEIASRASLTADCAAPSRLTRLELFMPGWRAWVNGFETPIVRVDELFQQIALPAGRSTVEYRFRPPYMPLGYVAFALGCIALIGRPRQKVKVSA